MYRQMDLAGQCPAGAAAAAAGNASHGWNRSRADPGGLAMTAGSSSEYIVMPDAQQGWSNMKYLSVNEARNLPGLRLVLTAYMPGPWGEAAKYILSARNVEFVPVEQLAMEKNDELFDWTGMRNAPIAVYNDEPPQSTWLEILLLAERVGSGPSLIPEDPIERALMMGFSTEICGPDGFAWSRRLEMMGRGSTRNPSDDGKYDMNRMARSYGVSPEAMARAPGRMISIMQGLAAQLRKQKAAGSEYFVGERLSACDLHWAAFAGFVSPLPPELCPMPDFMRDNYTHLTPELAAALDPVLLEHRDRVYERHIRLPMDF
jgi:glutathione S-transferase